MAMERPRARIIRIVLNNNVSERRQVLRISALGIFRIRDAYAIPLAGPSVQDVHVVPVEMHGVRGGVVVPDVDADGGIRAEVHDVPFGVVGVGIVLLLGEEQDRIVVISNKRVSVHVKQFLTSGIEELIDGHVICDAGFWDRDSVSRDCIVERIIGALSVIYGGGVGGCGWDGVIWCAINENDSLSFGIR